MKKILNMLFALFIGLSLCACSSNTGYVDSDEVKPAGEEETTERVVTTTREYKPFEDSDIIFNIPDYIYTGDNTLCVVNDEDKTIEVLGYIYYHQTNYDGEKNTYSSFEDYIAELNEYRYCKYEQVSENVYVSKADYSIYVSYMIKDINNESYVIDLQLQNCSESEINTIIDSISFSK